MSIFPLNDRQREILRDWLAWIENEQDLLCAAPSPDDHRLPRDSDTFKDWLVVESSLTAPALEEKIRHLPENGEWGTLAPDECFHLQFRLRLGREFIQNTLKHGEAISLVSIWPPDFSDPIEMRTWLLIDIWNDFGESFLCFWAEQFLAGVTVDEAAQTWTWNSPAP